MANKEHESIIDTTKVYLDIPDLSKYLKTILKNNLYNLF